MNLILSNRKFFITIFLILAGILFITLAMLDHELIDIALHYYGFLGVVGSAFIAANLGERAMNNRKEVQDASNSNKIVIG